MFVVGLREFPVEQAGGSLGRHRQRQIDQANAPGICLVEHRSCETAKCCIVAGTGAGAVARSCCGNGKQCRSGVARDQPAGRSRARLLARLRDPRSQRTALDLARECLVGSESRRRCCQAGKHDEAVQFAVTGGGLLQQPGECRRFGGAGLNHQITSCLQLLRQFVGESG
ncbi:MAG: hypothetical protein AW07_04514 [Candidatus Accumulibacter sp. SK-11]|nr:MAG: hypothetical protein AW07_04514 [Candidatus Accumulibacter sp. SK-11]